ncbi:type II toxin-antitoxin system VapC family toxin [Nitratireductor sp. ZSWI3]|uniref:type II toxin-antitoxin system VapC family toxin n=1 Tax=Nitratireductor sp. ZSWI3 TaxID=2966359 RepID=UPI00215064C7|nr:type II toxin-antitoxin system VapC family toxin [Nitratireductor sp. ZSWI3]MCR4267435.1 type II toxin-antitoxin system VapC family toxin [Nitratireductor sp. ZSWI3]
MTRFVLDASALLAVIRDERGADFVADRMVGMLMSTVNASEAIMRSVEKGFPFETVRSLIIYRQIDLVPFDWDMALAAARLRPDTKRQGLSFADRACLALAIRENATALTADRTWAELDLGCKIELIR